MVAARKAENGDLSVNRRPKQFRMPERVTHLIDRVARLQARSQTDVVIDAVTRYAEDQLLDQTVMAWDQAGYDAFAKAVEGPAQPSDYVIKARQRKRVWE